MHAWPELYFQGIGWVRFEPTPAARVASTPNWTVAATQETNPTTAPSTAPISRGPPRTRGSRGRRATATCRTTAV